MAAVTADQVEARVVETLASFGPDADQISRQSTFEELDIDSLDLVELAQVVEDEYGVVLKGEDMKDLKTERARHGTSPSCGDRAWSRDAAWDRRTAPARALGRR